MYLTENSRKRRDKIEIIYAILENCSLHRPIRKTRFIYKCNMAYCGVQRYLRLLLNFDLIKFTDDNRVLLTEKGLKVRNLLRELSRYGLISEGE